MTFPFPQDGLLTAEYVLRMEEEFVGGNSCDLQHDA